MNDNEAAVLADLLDAAEQTMSLWIRHGLGDDENESGPVYLKLERAILNARKLAQRRNHARTD